MPLRPRENNIIMKHCTAKTLGWKIIKSQTAAWIIIVVVVCRLWLTRLLKRKQGVLTWVAAMKTFHSPTQLCGHPHVRVPLPFTSFVKTAFGSTDSAVHNTTRNTSFFSFFFCSFPPFLRRQYQQQTQRNTVMTSVVRQVSQLCLHVDHVSTSKSSLLAAFSKRKDVELISGEAPARTSYLRYDLHACFYPMIVD